MKLIDTKMHRPDHSRKESCGLPSILRSCSCGAPDAYRRFRNVTYNPRSELTNAAIGTNQYGFIFDNIGNRETYTNNSEVFNYQANSLNQYTNIANGVTNTPTYDLDGNTLTYKGWTLVWNGENRIQSVSNGSTVVSFKYDYMGRRFSKTVEGISTNNFIYDGWNLIAEKSGGETTHHIWGLDLSGSMQGAGGVGGLLGTYADSTMYFACADANGNITEYTDDSGTNVVARYVYGAYGEIIDSSGDKVNDFKFLFSSKYLDRETTVSGYPGMYYYGYRYLWDSRWPSRDPIGELGFLNARPEFVSMRDRISARERGNLLYLYLLNSPASSLDVLGLAAYIKNNTGSTVLAIGNVFITEKCRKYFKDVHGRNVEEGLDGVVFQVVNGSDTANWAHLTDVDGYWTTFAPGTSGFAMKIRKDKTLTLTNIATIRTFFLSFYNDRNVTSFSSEFLGESIAARVNTRFDVTYRGWMISGVMACKCTLADYSNLNYAVTISRAAISAFPSAL